MNKIITVALIAGGLLLFDSPEAAAHKEVRNVYQPSSHYRVESRRAKHMPAWLKRNKSFGKWYRRTPLHNNRNLAWRQLFNIYRWEQAYALSYGRVDHYYGDHGYYRNYDRHGRHYDSRKRRL